jgi:hypothetical protein
MTSAARDKLLSINDPMVDAALVAHWGRAPCGMRRRQRIRDALIAAAKAGQQDEPTSKETGGNDNDA